MFGRCYRRPLIIVTSNALYGALKVVVLSYWALYYYYPSKEKGKIRENNIKMRILFTEAHWQI